MRRGQWTRKQYTLGNVVPSIGLVLIVALVYTNIARLTLHTNPVTAASLPANTLPVRTPSASLPQAQSATPEPVSVVPPQLPAQTPAAPKPTPALAPPPVCTGSYAAPAAIETTSLPVGLTARHDSPQFYTVYGDSLASLRASIAACPARKAIGNYHAVTSYQMNWSYNYRAGGAACQVVDVRVSLHTNQFLPAFAPSPSTPARLGDTWQRYTASLQTHENGHVAIDTDYAQRLTTALQALTAPDCNQLARVAQTTTESYVAMLDTANALYDSQTNHGATQGAVL